MEPSRTSPGTVWGREDCPTVPRMEAAGSDRHLSLWVRQPGGAWTGVPLALHHVPILPSASRWHLPRRWAGDRDSPSCSAHCYRSLWRGHPGAGASASCHRLSPPLCPPARAIAPGTQKEADLKPARARAECRSLAKSRLCSRRGVGCPSVSTHGDCAGASALSRRDLGLPPARCPGTTLSPRGPWSRLRGGLRWLSAPRRALGRARVPRRLGDGLMGLGRVPCMHGITALHRLSHR